MKLDFRIEIPKPCRAGWETMEAAEKGRFCGECSKIVIDFTSMTTDEIKTYFLQHRDQKICRATETRGLVRTSYYYPWSFDTRHMPTEHGRALCHEDRALAPTPKVRRRHQSTS